jgi:hypothetical protein
MYRRLTPEKQTIPTTAMLGFSAMPYTRRNLISGTPLTPIDINFIYLENDNALENRLIFMHFFIFSLNIASA